MTNVRVSSAGSRFRSRAAGEGLSSMLGPGAKTVQSGRGEVRIREGRDFKALLISNSVNCISPENSSALTISSSNWSSGVNSSISAFKVFSLLRLFNNLARSMVSPTTSVETAPLWASCSAADNLRAARAFFL